MWSKLERIKERKNKLAIKELIDLILDTTPRQWIHYWQRKLWFLNPVALFHFYLEERNKDRFLFKKFTPNFVGEFRKQQSRQKMFYFVSVFGHGILLLSFYFLFAAKPLDELADNDALDVGEFLALASLSQLSPDVETVYDPYGDVKVVKPVKKKKKKSAKSRMAQLLEKLSQMTPVQVDENAQPSEDDLKNALAKIQKSKSGSKTDRDALMAQRQKLLADMRERNSQRQNMGAKVASLVKLIGKKSESFQECYEKALLTDQDLSVHASFLFSLGGKGEVDKTLIRIRGAGSGKSKRVLDSCLKSKTRLLSFPETYKGMKFKFNLLFKS